MGTSVHEVLECVYRQHSEGADPADVDMTEALERYKNIFWNSEALERIRVIKANTVQGDYYDRGKKYLISFFKRVFKVETATTLYLEQSFEIPLAEDIRYKGIIDRITREENGKLRVTDFKTGKAPHPLDNLQLPSYALFIFDNNMDNEIELCIEDLKTEQTVTVPFQRSEIRRVRDQLLFDIRTIQGTREFPAAPSVLCYWCGYNHICGCAPEAVKKGEPYVEKPKPPAPMKPVSGCCPHCGGELRERKGKFGSFMGCSNYPHCRYTYDLGENGQERKVTPETEGKDICPECGSLLKERKGRYGDFWGCTSFPQCRFTRPV